MDLLTPTTIYGSIRHRLSIIYSNQYQDKDGCSLNGFRRLICDCYEESEEYPTIDQFLHAKISRSDTILDKRGCPIYLSIFEALY